ELASQNIRVNAICPGLIATSIFGAAIGAPRPLADQIAARVAETGAKAHPIRKPGLPEDIARAALYLASDEAAFVTCAHFVLGGAHFGVDGGIPVGPRGSWAPRAPQPLAELLAMPQ